jgi:hypothetical protein
VTLSHKNNKTYKPLLNYFLMAMKADLRTFPHFYSPRGNPNVPSLNEIVQEWMNKRLEIVSLTSCHTKTSGIDYRWEDYMQQLWNLNCLIGDYRSQGFVKLIINNKPIIILNSQQVRTKDGDRRADINIIGAPTIIQPTRPIEETIEEARSYGAAITACHINDYCGLLLIKEALPLLEAGKLDALEVEAGKRKTQVPLLAELQSRGIKPLPVTGGHNYKQAGTSYAFFSNPLEEGFSIPWLAEEIRSGNFTTPNYGKLSFFSEMWHAGRHILLSRFKHLKAGGEQAEEYKQATIRRK